MPMKDIMKEIGKAWNDLPPSKKQELETKSRQDKNRYLLEMSQSTYSTQTSKP